MKLKELRDNARMTQPALANALGVSVRAIAAWEAGDREPKSAMMIQIANLFGVTLDALLERVPGVDDYTLNEEAIIAEFQNMSIEQQQDVIAYAKFVQKK